MHTEATTQRQPQPYFSDTVAMIGLGTLLLLLTMFILTLFHNDIFGQQNVSASTPSLVTSKAANPGLTTLAPVPQSIGVNAAQLSAEDQLRAIIERANRAFIEGRSSANANALAPVAVGDWLSQEQGYLAAMRGRSQTERWRLVNIQFVKIEPRGSTAFVCTRETWEYSILNANGVATPLRSIVVDEGYYLTNTPNGWFVNKVEIN